MDDLPDGMGKAFIINGQKIALFKLSSGKIHAIENRCPHKGGELSQGIVSGDFVYCPLHDWNVCTRDGMVQSPDTGCVKTFKTEVNSEDIFIFLDEN